MKTIATKYMLLLILLICSIAPQRALAQVEGNAIVPTSDSIQMRSASATNDIGASFITDKTNYCLGESVITTNHSTSINGAIISYLWDFGNGTFSSDIEPVYTYPSPGIYTITLTITDEINVTSSKSRTVEIFSIPDVEPITGVTELFVGKMAQLRCATVGGSWESLNPLVASVIPQTGITIGLSKGIAEIHYEVVDLNGCKNLSSTEIVVKKPGTSYVKQTLCTPEIPYSWNGQTITSEGMYIANLITANGGDSIAYFEVTIASPSSSVSMDTICRGEVYSFNGYNFTTTGTYLVVIPNVAGCDSMMTLNLYVKEPSYSSTYASICEGESYTFNGITYTTASTYQTKLINAVGCDSIATLYLEVKAKTSSTLKVSVCAGESYTFNNSTYNTSGSYSHHFINAKGCDSTATLVLTVKPHKTTVLNEVICANETYTFDGIKISKSGTYNAYLKATNGCDSTVTLYLTVKPVYNKTQNLDLNFGQFYEINNKFYDKAGTYVDVFTAKNGCDSTITTIIKYARPSCPELIVPKFFTPNGDGENDRLEIENLTCREHVTVYIYDRAGVQLFSYYENDFSWDGSSSGKELPSADYWYVIVLHDTNERVLGHFLLRR